MPAQELSEAGKYLAGAFGVFLVLLLIYIAIMASKLSRMERELGELGELAERRPPRAAEEAAAGGRERDETAGDEREPVSAPRSSRETVK